MFPPAKWNHDPYVTVTRPRIGIRDVGSDPSIVIEQLLVSCLQSCSCAAPALGTVSSEARYVLWLLLRRGPHFSGEDNEALGGEVGARWSGPT